ncbi:MAG: argininosuccinate lyase [Alphaproteobacteria bacterium]|nr:argininosuccinate lyase [Alphaproteobacteria bacterium]
MSSNRMWGGRFRTGPAQAMEEITPSIDFDKRLAREDLACSRAHVAMLADRKIIDAADRDAILKGLDTIEHEIAEDKFVYRRSLEDIHLNIESRLAELIGPAAGRLHTARSRNDQVATDLRLWLRDAISGLDSHLKDLQRALVAQAGQHAGTTMPGFTHMQPAQPVTFGHHCLAYVEMLERDRSRLADCSERLNESPLGAAALAGTAFPIDRDATSAALGFRAPMRNSLDAVSARDFALEFLSVAAIAATHLSRLAAEIVQWTSPAFGFVALSDAFSTGSSIMPQKRNPDAAELVRGKTGRVVGDFVGLATVLKGLPLAYGSDLQEDKERVFDAYDTLVLAFRVMAGMVADLKANPDRMKKAAGLGHPTATDLADWIVRKTKKPFREAHHAAGAIVKRADELQKTLDEMPLAEMRKIEPGIDKDVFSVLGVESSVASRVSKGGTAPVRVREQIAFWQERLK